MQVDNSDDSGAADSTSRLENGGDGGGGANDVDGSIDEGEDKGVDGSRLEWCGWTTWSSEGSLEESTAATRLILDGAAGISSAGVASS